MATATEIIKASLRRIAAIESESTPTTQELSDGLEALNDLIESWSGQYGLIYAVSRETFTLTPNKDTYTIGPSGDFNTSRPRKIKHAVLIDGNISYRVRIINYREYDWIPNRSVFAQPTRLYYIHEYPVGKVLFDYRPDRTYQITLTLQQALPTFPDLTTDVSYPPDYVRALKNNLAIEISSEYGIDPSPTVIAAARSSIRNLITQNTRIQPLRTPPGIEGNSRYNIYADE